MANKKRPKFSQEEIVACAAEVVAMFIDIESMELDIKELDNFVEYFKEKAHEMFQTQDYLLLSIGANINTDGEGIYSNNMRTIINFIKEKRINYFK